MCRGQVEDGQSRPEREVWVSLEEPWPRSSDCVLGTVGSLWVAFKGSVGSDRWFRTALTAGENEGNWETREAGGCGHQMPVGDPMRTEKNCLRFFSPPDSVTWGGLTSPVLWFHVCKNGDSRARRPGLLWVLSDTCSMPGMGEARSATWSGLEAVLRKCGWDDPPTFPGAGGYRVDGNAVHRLRGFRRRNRVGWDDFGLVH